MYSHEEAIEASLKYFKGDRLATDAFISKYALKDVKGNLFERTPDDMHKRLAREFSRIENNYLNPLSEDEIYNLLKDFKYIIPGGSPMMGIGNDNLLTSLSNCFVIESPYDSYPGIMNTEQQMVSIMKRRGGVGLAIDSLRSKNIPTTSVSEKSSGIVLFSERYSNTTREVAQDGRRGALMISCRVDHPDIEMFIEAKTDLNKITGANVSVMITDSFMEAVKSDSDYELYFEMPSGLRYGKFTSARSVWNKIIQSAWKSAEPGVLFWDTILRESPADCYAQYGFKTVSTNPCLVGETIVAVADGRNGVSIKELSEKGEPFPVYSARENKSSNRKEFWKAEIKNAIAFYSGNKKVIEVVLSDGSSFKCTNDHLLAKSKGGYIKAEDSVGFYLSKFFTFSEKNNKKSYRTINSINNGYSRQYSMMFKYNFGDYDGKLFNVDHIDSDSTNDDLSNLKLVSIENHKSITDRSGKNNPINKINKELLSYLQKEKNLLANSKKYNWSKERLEEALKTFHENNTKPVFTDKNCDLTEDVYVSKIVECGFEDVYDLKVEDNHNFYIITNTDDSKFLNSSGVLVHNCGEIPLSPFDSCRLMALNLYSYVVNQFTNDSYFDYELFDKHVRIAQRLMDDMVDLEIEKINSIIKKIENDVDPEELKQIELKTWKSVKEAAINGRRTGLGITAEGDMLAALGLRYGSDEGIEVSERVHKIMAMSSYKSSIEMAKERGCFPIFNQELEKNNPFLKRIFPTLYCGVNDYHQHGRRNIANLTIAPTGTVSLMTQTTSGIEPVFMVRYERKRKVQVKGLNTTTDEKGDIWEKYYVIHPKFIDWYELNWYKIDSNWFDIDYKPSLEDCDDETFNKIFKASPYYKSTANDIDWVAKVKMQGRIQKWIDHSISVTVNLPNNTTVETVDKIYMTAYEVGCKGLTIYRDGCRQGILTNIESKSSEFNYIDAPKRDKSLSCDIYTKTALGRDFTIIVGLMNKKPYEIFAFEQLSNTEFPRDIKKGTLTKVKSRVYKLAGIKGDKEYIVENILTLMKEDELVNTRRYSLQLRHGINPFYIHEQIDKYATITSFDKVIGRVLKMYTNGEKTKDLCPQCGALLVMQDGCEKCVNCTYSKCG